MKKQTKQSNMQHSEETIILHFSAMIYAADYIDECLRQIQQPGANEIVPASILMNTKLPALENRPSTISQLQKQIKAHLKEFSTDIPSVMSAPPPEPEKAQYTNINLNAAHQLLRSVMGVPDYMTWFLSRVESKDFPQYYERIALGMWFGLVCARFYQTKMENPELAYGDVEVDQFFAFRPDDFGQYWNFNQPLPKKVGSIANFRTIESIGEILVINANEKPRPYASLLEFIRDLLQIGVNCLFFNASHQDFVKLSNKYLNQIYSTYDRLMPSRPLPEWTRQALDVNLIDAQMRYKRNGYNAITNNFLVDSNSDEITKEKIAFGAEVVKLLEVFMDAPYFTQEHASWLSSFELDHVNTMSLEQLKQIKEYILQNSQ